MAEIKKLTKKEKYGMVLEYIPEDKEFLKEFIVNEIALLEKKANSSSKTKVQVENEVIKEKIVAYLTETKKRYTITEFQTEFEDMATYSNQKLSALFTQLKKENKVSHIQDKKKSYFFVEIA